VLVRDSLLLLIGGPDCNLPASIDGGASALMLPLDATRLVAPPIAAPFDALVAMSLYECALPPPPFAVTATQQTSLVHGPAIVGELAVVDYVRKHGVQRAVDHFSLKARYHEQHRNLVALSYTEAASDFSSPVVRQCRGIVLDAKNNYRPVCLPFDKFFNLGDDRADQLDWSSVVITEKLDGSFAKLYHYGGEWHVASMSVPDGNGNVNNTATFAQIFWELFRTCHYAVAKAGRTGARRRRCVRDDADV
jgi:hypothetical protein